MQLSSLLEERHLSTYQCARMSGIAYTTLLELVKGKTKVEKCSAETLYRLSLALNITMDELYRMRAPRKRVLPLKPLRAMSVIG